MSKVYDSREHTYLTFKYPHQTKENRGYFSGLWQIVLHVGSRVWINADYSMTYTEGMIQVGDGQTNGYAENGDCIISIPAEWCEFWKDEEAESIQRMQEADEDLLAQAIG